MAVLVSDYPHRTGEHCASTALRNVMAHRGIELSEPMIFGLASGLGFVYLRSDQWSPTRMFHGRTQKLESDFCRNTELDFDEPFGTDDETAWKDLKQRIDAGRPVMIATDRDSSASKSRNAAASASAVGPSMQLRTSGRSRVTMAVVPRVS